MNEHNTHVRDLTQGWEMERARLVAYPAADRGTALTAQRNLTSEHDILISNLTQRWE